MIKRLLITLLMLVPAVYAQGPDTDSRLWNDATVYRDEWGVPHIYANTPRSMAFVFGYAQAEDHLEDMLRAYRVANGRASEVYGPAFIESDKHALIMRHADLAEAAYDDLDKITQHLCEGFAAGVNTWIVEHPNEVPAWAEGVSPIDILALLHHYLSTMAPLDVDNVYAPAKGTPLANAWALDSSRTKEGNPMLVMNPHTDYDGVFQWYEAHIITRDMNMYGATLFGLPVLLMGHNEDLGWALAPNEPDMADVYSVQENPVPYTNESDTRELHVWQNKSMKTHTIERLMTWNGPVLAFENGNPLVYKVGGYRDFGGLRQLYDMGRARNLTEFQSAWDKQQLPLFHVIYADRDDNLFYSYNAKVGDKSLLVENRSDIPRLSETRWESTLNTQIDEMHWGKDLSLVDELPWILNPDSGYIQASGTPPWLVTEGTEWTEDDFDDWLIRDPDTYRAKRLRQLFSQGKRSFNDNQAMLYDIVVPLAAETVPFILEAAQANQAYVNETHPILNSVLNLLDTWDFQAHPDSKAMTFFHIWWTLYSREFSHQGTATETLHAMLQNPNQEMQRYILNSAAHAARMMYDYYQSTSVPWGDVHVIQRGTKTVAIGGSYTGEPLFGMGDQYFKNGKWISKQGPGFTMAVEFGKYPHATSALPFGTSQHPNSLHFDDQLTLMQQRRLKHTHFSRADVEQHTVSGTGKAIALSREHSGVSLLVRAERPVTVRLGLANTLNIELPEGYAAFSTFIEPVAKPARVKTENTLEIHIPASLCTKEGLGELGVFAYTPNNGWTPVEDQEINWDKRTFYAWGYNREVYAVLGPQDLLLGEISQEAYDDFFPDVAKMASTTHATKPFAPFLATDAKPLSKAEMDRIAKARPTPDSIDGTFLPDGRELPTTTINSGTIVTENDGNIKHMKLNGALVPAVPPGWKEFLRNQDSLPDRPNRVERERRLPPRQTLLSPKNARTTKEELFNPTNKLELPSPKELAMMNSAESGAAKEFEELIGTPLPTEPEISVESLDAAPPVMKENPQGPQAPETPSPTRPKDLDELTSLQPNKTRPEKAAANNPFRDKKGALIVQPGLPETMSPNASSAGPPSLALAPDISLATRLVINEKNILSFPRFGAEFTLTMTQKVRSQMAFRPSPAEPYPNGLVPFTPLFDVFYSPVNTKGAIAISMRIDPKVCAPEKFDSLVLYAYDSRSGWAPVEEVKKSVETMSFSALDFNVRNYVVLGPKEAQLTPPKMLP